MPYLLLPSHCYAKLKDYLLLRMLSSGACTCDHFVLVCGSYMHDWIGGSCFGHPSWTRQQEYRHNTTDLGEFSGLGLGGDLLNWSVFLGVSDDFCWHMSNVSCQAFPVFHHSSASIHCCQCKPKNKKRGRPGNAATLTGYGQLLGGLGAVALLVLVVAMALATGGKLHKQWSN